MTEREWEKEGEKTKAAVWPKFTNLSKNHEALFSFIMLPRFNTPIKVMFGLEILIQKYLKNSVYGFESHLC